MGRHDAGRPEKSTKEVTHDGTIGGMGSDFGYRGGVSFYHDRMRWQQGSETRYAPQTRLKGQYVKFTERKDKNTQYSSVLYWLFCDFWYNEWVKQYFLADQAGGFSASRQYGWEKMIPI